MQLSIGVGNSSKIDGYAAGLEAAGTVKEQLGDDSPDFVFVFSTIGYEHQDILDAVAEKLGDVPMSGATFEGIIGREFVDESMYAVQIVGLKSNTIHFYNIQSTNAVEQPLQAGEDIGRQVEKVAQDGKRVLFLFPDFKTNITSLFEGIEKHCKLPFIGGASGDNLKFQQCFQFHDGEVMENACCAVLMVGDFELMTIVTHGSEPLSDARVVTKCTGNVIYEIDGKPALDIAGEGLGEEITPENITSAVTLMGIGFKTAYSPDFLSPYVVRAIHGFNFEDGSCIIPTVVTEGSEIRFMRRDPSSVLESARAGGEKLSIALDSLNVTPKLICQFDCAGRGKGIVGDDVHRGMAMVQDAFEHTVPWMGLFAFGEISPMKDKNCFHNFTATLAVFY
jgi:hypothetical protein